MSYTAPQYVDTKEQAILALASTIKGEAVTGGDGSVNRALDVLADVLAEQDVQVPQTDAGAILALAQYVTGGGGGGSSDFTTAKVSLTNNASEPFIVPIPNIYNDTLISYADSVDMDGSEYDVVLYKGLLNGIAVFGNDQTVVSAVSGDVHIVDGLVVIEGSGSITFADA